MGTDYTREQIETVIRSMERAIERCKKNPENKYIQTRKQTIEYYLDDVRGILNYYDDFSHPKRREGLVDIIS